MTTRLTEVRGRGRRRMGRTPRNIQHHQYEILYAVALIYWLFRNS